MKEFIINILGFIIIGFIFAILLDIFPDNIYLIGIINGWISCEFVNRKQLFDIWKGE